MYDLKTYPSAKEIVHAWRQGIKAQRMARLAGLHKADDEEDKGDHDEGDDGDDDDTSSLPKWFMNPYKDVSLTQLFENTAADDDAEETLVAASTLDPNSDWGTQDKQDCALFAESQRLIGSTLHDADVIEVQ